MVSRDFVKAGYLHKTPPNKLVRNWNGRIGGEPEQADDTCVRENIIWYILYVCIVCPSSMLHDQGCMTCTINYAWKEDIIYWMLSQHKKAWPGYSRAGIAGLYTQVDNWRQRSQAAADECKAGWTVSYGISWRKRGQASEDEWTQAWMVSHLIGWGERG